MPIPNTINELKWQSLTRAINEIKSPNQFLKRLLFARNPETKSTEDIEYSAILGEREAAPLVKKGAEALLVSGYGEEFYTVSTPNIRIKRPIEASDLLFGRRPGTVIFPTGQEQISAAAAHMARQTQRLADLITNAEEYLCSMAIQGAISYSVADEEVFTLTYPRLGTHTVTLSTFWDDPSPTPETDFTTAMRLVNNDVGLGVTHAIMGLTAADTFVGLSEVRTALDIRNLNVGGIDLTTQYQEDGARFLGRYIGGIGCWEYSRTVSVNGSAVDLVRKKYVEFVSAVPAAENVLYYGAIPDMQAFQGRLFQSQRFSKAWMQEDPSVMLQLAHSRPLPVPRRSNSMVSMKVISG